MRYTASHESNRFFRLGHPDQQPRKTWSGWLRAGLGKIAGKQILGLALLAALPLAAQNHQSAIFAGAQGINVTVPASAPYTAIGSERWEYRITACCSAGQTIATFGNLIIGVGAAGVLRITSFYDSGSPTAQITGLSASTGDYLVRAQRDITTHQMTIEVWSSAGTRQYLYGATLIPNVTDFSTHSHAGTGTVGWNGGGGFVSARMAWLRWYSTTVALGSAPPSNVPGGDLMDLEFEGGITDSSAHALVATMGAGSLTYATTPIVADYALAVPQVIGRSGTSITLDASPTNAAAYFWQQTAGPDTCSISSRTVAAPVVVCTLFGEHDFQLQVTDSTGASSLSTLPVGIAATTSAGVTVIADATINFIVGAQLRSGITAWTWYDAMADQMSDYWYGLPASQSGNFLCIAQLPDCTWAALLNVGGDPSINYYDAVLVLYQQYYRTGLTKYRTRARALALFFWANYWNSGSPAGGCNSNWSAPRDGTAGGLLLYERESGDTSMYTCLDQWIDYELNLWIDSENASHGYTSFAFGSREPAYAYFYASLEAQRDPNNSTYHWLTRVTAGFSGVWQAFQCTASSTNAECANATTVGPGTVTIAHNATAVTGSGTNFLSTLSTSFRFWPDDGVSDLVTNWNWFNPATIPTNTSATITSSYPYTATSGRPWAYDTASPSTIPPGAYRWVDPAWAGYGEQQWHTAIAMEGIINYHLLTGDAAALTLLSRWTASVTANGISTTPCEGVPGITRNFLLYQVYSGTPEGDGCPDVSGLQGSRSQNNTSTHAYGYLYLNGTTAAKTTGDLLFSADYGQCCGPGADGYAGLAQSQSNMGKEYGQAYRSSGHYLAYTTGATPAVINRSMIVGFSLPANAASVSVTDTAPDGTIYTASCASSPCTVEADASQGNHIMQLTYKSAGAATVAQGAPFAVVVQ